MLGRHRKAYALGSILRLGKRSGAALAVVVLVAPSCAEPASSPRRAASASISSAILSRDCLASSLCREPANRRQCAARESMFESTETVIGISELEPGPAGHGGYPAGSCCDEYAVAKHARRRAQRDDRSSRYTEATNTDWPCCEGADTQKGTGSIGSENALQAFPFPGDRWPTSSP